MYNNTSFWIKIHNIIFYGVLHYIFISEVELRQALVEVEGLEWLDELMFIVCIASVTSSCKFFGRVFISLGYLSKLISEKKKNINK